MTNLRRLIEKSNYSLDFNLKSLRKYEEAIAPECNRIIDKINDNTIYDYCPVIKLDKFDKFVIEDSQCSAAKPEWLESAKIANLLSSKKAVIYSRDNEAVEISDHSVLNYLFPDYIAGYVYPELPETPVTRSWGSTAVKVGVTAVLAAAVIASGCTGAAPILKGPDDDGDGYTNAFEIAHANPANHLDPGVYNGRYAMIINSEGKNNIVITSKYTFLVGAGYKPENIEVVADFTRDSVKNAIDRIASKATENDTVLITVGNDGSEGIFGNKYNGQNIGYDEFSSWIDEINATEILMIDACYSGSAIPFLKQGKQPRVIYTQVASDQNAYGNLFSSNFFRSQGGLIDGTGKVLYTSLKTADYNNDGFVSIGESGKYAANSVASEKPTSDNKYLPLKPQMSDESGIADYLFIAEKPAVLEEKDAGPRGI